MTSLVKYLSGPGSPSAALVSVPLSKSKVIYVRGAYLSSACRSCSSQTGSSVVQQPYPSSWERWELKEPVTSLPLVSWKKQHQCCVMWCHTEQGKFWCVTSTWHGKADSGCCYWYLRMQQQQLSPIVIPKQIAWDHLLFQSVPVTLSRCHELSQSFSSNSTFVQAFTDKCSINTLHISLVELFPLVLSLSLIWKKNTIVSWKFVFGI